MGVCVILSLMYVVQLCQVLFTKLVLLWNIPLFIYCEEAVATFSVEQSSLKHYFTHFLFHSCHLPLLYSGLEYGLMKNFKLAEKLLEEALIIAPSDPFVLHEMGVINFHNGE